MRFEPYRVDARKLAHEGKDRDVTEPSRAASEIILVGEPRIELKEHVQTGGAMHPRILAMARCIFITVKMLLEGTVIVRAQARVDSHCPPFGSVLAQRPAHHIDPFVNHLTIGEDEER